METDVEVAVRRTILAIRCFEFKLILEKKLRKSIELEIIGA